MSDTKKMEEFEKFCHQQGLKLNFKKGNDEFGRNKYTSLHVDRIFYGWLLGKRQTLTKVEAVNNDANHRKVDVEALKESVLLHFQEYFPRDGRTSNPDAHPPTKEGMLRGKLVCKVIDHLASQDHLIAQPEWLPIDTAPKDGSEFLAYSPSSSLCSFTVSWNENLKTFCEYGQEVRDITHWRHKLTPPKQEGK